jgi:hypothetical protein
MKIKILLIAGLMATVIAILAYLNRPGAPADKPATAHQPADISAAPKTLPPENAMAVALPPRIAGQNQSPVVAQPAITEDTTQNDQPLTINGYVVQDPLARAALSFVGTDPDANAYWISAINNPGLPSEERKDLIEDLNADGFPDPDHPGPADAPLIASRIQLIEELAPYAMDQVDARAFAEAEKDLVGMLNGQAPQ